MTTDDRNFRMTLRTMEDQLPTDETARSAALDRMLSIYDELSIEGTDPPVGFPVPAGESELVRLITSEPVERSDLPWVLATAAVVLVLIGAFFGLVDRSPQVSTSEYAALPEILAPTEFVAGAYEAPVAGGLRFEFDRPVSVEISSDEHLRLADLETGWAIDVFVPSDLAVPLSGEPQTTQIDTLAAWVLKSPSFVSGRVTIPTTDPTTGIAAWIGGLQGELPCISDPTGCALAQTANGSDFNLGPTFNLVGSIQTDDNREILFLSRIDSPNRNPDVPFAKFLRTLSLAD